MSAIDQEWEQEETVRRDGRTSAQQAAELLSSTSDEMIETELPEERERSFRLPGLSRIRTDWDGPDGSTMHEVHAKVEEIVDTAFSDLYAVRNAIYDLVREPVVVRGVVQLDEHGFPRWAVDITGNYIEDWSKITHSERERFIYLVVTRLFDWQERADRLWAEAMMAKTQWEESFAEGWKEATGAGRATDAAKQETAKSHSIGERYFAVYATYVSRRAESLVRGMERLEQRLKDLHTNGR